MNTRNFSLALVASIGLAGCGSSSSGNGVDHWQGEMTHLAITGTFQGHTYDIHQEGAAAAGVTCSRFYAPLPGEEPDAAGNYDTSQVYFVMKELGGVIDVDGTPTMFTISYWRHDVAAGTDLHVIPRVFGTSIPAGQTWSDINLFLPGGDDLSGIESAALSGTVSMKLNSGGTDAGGIMVPAGGRTGEYISASWGPNEDLHVSATADCVLSIVVTWPQTRILP